MREVKRSALVAQPPGRMFALINDIERYPEFLPWCSSAAVISRTETEIVATIGIKRGPLHTEFTTRNALERDHRINMHFVSGPFRKLEGRWCLTPVGTHGTRVDLEMEFEFSQSLIAAIVEPVFESTAGSLVEAFVKRARALDGAAAGAAADA